ncbi:MAG: TrmH family RNA methyltransferase, partial [Bryobacteraceae bacterium]
MLAGIHPVREALRARRPLDRVLVARGAAGPRLQEIVDLCRGLNIPVRFEPRDRLDRASDGAAHQGVVGIGAIHKYTTLDAIAERARMLVILDGVEDPHNLGAVVRTANAAGADAVVIPERRAASATAAACKASAGALEHLSV